ncbi:MAG: triple tyrosine motif-containing protein [Crocinitomicaceae bacterium]
MRFVLLFSLIITALFTFGQNNNYKHFSTNSGLSSSEAYGVIQDDWGYIWISTDHGLNRYDGYQMKHFSTEDGLTDNTVFRFKKDPFGRIWCTTYNNTLFLIQGNKPQFIPYKYNEILQKVGKNRVLKEIYFDKTGNIYITFLLNLGYIKIAPNGELTDRINRASFPKTEFRRYHLGMNQDVFISIDSSMADTENSCSESVNFINTNKAFTEYRTNMIYFKPNETYVYAGPNNIIIQSANREDVKIKLNSELTQLEKLNDQFFWYSGINLGLQIYDIEGKLIAKFLEGYSVTNTHLDHEGSLWITTLEDGVFLVKNWKYANFDKKGSLISISDLEIDNNNQLWVGYSDGDIYVKKGGKMVLKHSSLTGKSVKFGLTDSNELFYIQSDYLFNQARTDSIYIGFNYNFAIKSFEPLDVLICNYSGISRKTEKLLPADIIHKGVRVKDYTKANDSTMYFAGHSGVYKQTPIGLELIDSNQLIFQQRFDAITSNNNYLVAGSRGSGIICIKDSSCYMINSKNGLAGDFVNTLQFENDSTLWVGTNRGISVITKTQKNVDILNIGRKKGLFDEYVTDFAFLKDTIWVGTRKGLSYLLRSDLRIKNAHLDYQVYVDGIKINGISSKAQNNFKLDHDENKISFNFLTLAFASMQQKLYRFKLVGSENKWNYTTSTSASYSSLGPGNYTFKVQFKGENETWDSESIPIHFQISKPFWKTWWFIISTISLVLGFIYLFFKYKVIIYNGDVLREILRYILKKLKKDENYIIINEAGKEYRINTADILYVKSDKNYLEVYTTERKHVIREKIGAFLDLVPDPLEFIRVKRSYIIRIDKVTEKGKKHVKIDQVKIEVGDTYLDQLEKIQF